MKYNSILSVGAFFVNSYRADYKTLNTERHQFIHKRINFLLILAFLFSVCILSGCKPVIKLTVTPSSLSGKAPLDVTFDAKGTTDKDCTELTYKWDFGDGSEIQSGVNLAEQVHTYTQSGTYTATLKVVDCKTISSSATKSVIITVEEPDNPIVIKLYADIVSGITPMTVNFDAIGTSQNGTTDLTYEWDFENDGTIDASGINLTTPSHTYTEVGTFIAKLTVTGKDGITASETISIEVKEPGPINISLSAIPLSGEAPLNVQFDATGTSQEGSSELIYEWDFNDDGIVDTSGINLIKVSHTYGAAGTYTAKLKVKNTNFFSSSESATASITVSKTSNPIVGEYANLIPEDSEAAYDPKRFAVITGEVKNEIGLPLNDVTVTIHKLNELEGHYGKTETKDHGTFSIAVNGGGNLTIQYERPNYLTVHRQINISCNDIKKAETVVMIPKDAASKEINFDGNANTIIMHQSTVQTDNDGSRSCSLIFSGDNKAYELDASGNRIKELSDITVRATEYTVGTNGPKAMPASLPPTIAYTYCVELSVDGVERVGFSKPVTMYVNNFLNFAVGTRAPVGSYNRDKGVWIPEKNGLIVRLLHIDDGTTPSNVVNAIDSNGDYQPDSLDASGLDDPEKFHPDDTYCRIEVTHFTPFDINYPYGPPDDAIMPNPDSGPSTDPNADNKQCDTETNSYIEDRGRVYHEDITVPDTDFTLHYASNRVEGYKEKITVPASGDYVPASLSYIIVTLDVAGRHFSKILPGAANQTAVFDNWDGLDFKGNPVSRSVKATIRIGFVYPAVYYINTDTVYDVLWSMFGNYMTDIPIRYGGFEYDDVGSYTLWSSTELTIPARLIKICPISEGWSLSVHHHIDPNNQNYLYKGDGKVVKSATPLMSRYAGVPGQSEYNGDNIPATTANINVSDFTIDAAGNMYIADSLNGRIRKIDKNNIITTVAQVSYPFSCIDVDNKGNIYFANSRAIWKRNVSGNISLIAGDPNNNSAVSSGLTYELALGAVIIIKSKIVVDDWGNIYFIQSGGIYKVDTAGMLTRISNADGGRSLDMDAHGILFYSQWGNDIPPSCVIKLDNRGNKEQICFNRNPSCWFEISAATVDKITGDLYVTQYKYFMQNCFKERIVKKTMYGGERIIAGLGDLTETTNPLEKRVGYGNRVVIDNSGNIYIGADGIWKISSSGSNTKTIPQMSSDDYMFVEEGIGYIFDNKYRHKMTVDLDTGATIYSFGYNDKDSLISITDRFNKVTTIGRDSSDKATSITSPNNVTTILDVNSTTKKLDSIIYPDETSYGFEYTTDGLMTIETDPRKNSFRHVFDDIGRVTDVYDYRNGNAYGHWNFVRENLSNGVFRTTVTTGEGNATIYDDTYSSTGEFNSVITGPTGAQTTYSQSADELEVTKSLSCGMDLHFLYALDDKFSYKYIKTFEQSSGGLIKLTSRNRVYTDENSDNLFDLIKDTISVNGKSTTILNDLVNSEKTFTTPEGRIYIIGYNPLTLMAESISATGINEIQYQYDPSGRPTLISSGDRLISATYNDESLMDRIITVNDGIDTTVYHYDIMDRLRIIQQSDGTLIHLNYDANGNMESLTKPKWDDNTIIVEHLFGFNEVNLFKYYSTPFADDGDYKYDYYRDRTLKSVTYPSGNIVNLERSMGRLELISLPAGEGTIDPEWKCSSKIDSITRNSEKITFGYELNGVESSLLTSEIIEGTINQTIGYGYDNDYNLRSISYAGASYGLDYDRDGLLSVIGDYTITLKPENGLPSAVTGNNLSINRTFTPYGETDTDSVKVAGVSNYSVDLDYDDQGKISVKTETIGSEKKKYVYTYEAGRLHYVDLYLNDSPTGTRVEEYEYYYNGARKSEINYQKGISQKRSFSYSEDDRMLTIGDGEVGFGYNLDGFQATKTIGSDVTRYTYSSLGELTKVVLPGGKTIEYTYDPYGRRIERKVNGAVTDRYLWAGQTTLLAVYDGGNNLKYRFEYADARMPVSMMTGSGDRYYLAYDQVGSLRLVIDSDGDVQRRINYDTFGYVISDNNSALDVPFGFAGGLYDHETRLCRFGYRDYDTETGRWTAKDPIFFAGGDTNLYGYCVNDPVNWVDPEGLYIGQMPPAPHGYNPSTWGTGQWDNGNWFVKSPEGRIYTAHPEDINHWRHWDIQEPGGGDGGSTPCNPGKRRQNQKKLKGSQSDTDPSGNEPEWTPPSTGFIPFMPIDPNLAPIRIPFRVPFRVPIPVW
jgi:RHS repeat-associated protein